MAVRMIQTKVSAARSNTNPLQPMAFPIPALSSGIPNPVPSLDGQPAYVERPAVQDTFSNFIRRERCGHMSGLLVRPKTAGLDEVREASGFIRGSCCDARRGFRPGLLRDVVPLVHRLLCTSTCRPLPVSSSARFAPHVGTLSAANLVGPRYVPPRTKKAQIILAVLLASATETTLYGRRAINSRNQGRVLSSLRTWRRMDVAPTTNRDLNCELPIFEMRPRRCFPPLECDFGVNPIHAAK